MGLDETRKAEVCAQAARLGHVLGEFENVSRGAVKSPFFNGCERCGMTLILSPEGELYGGGLLTKPCNKAVCGECGGLLAAFAMDADVLVVDGGWRCTVCGKVFDHVTATRAVALVTVLDGIRPEDIAHNPQ